MIGIIVIMRLSVGEQGGIGEQLTSCEESVKQGGGERGIRRRVRTHC